MDFAIWSILKSEACSSNHSSVEALKAKLHTFWEEISPEAIRASCSQLHYRLKRLVEAKGEYIEK